MTNKPSKRTSTVTLPLDERLRDSRSQATSMTLPLAIHHRLDVLAELATDLKASRAEIIGTLIAGAALNIEQLEEAVLKYRKMTVRDTLPKTPDDPDPGQTGDNVITLPLRQPGRPPNRAAG